MRTLLQRLENMSIPEPNSGCFLWTGPVQDTGYPKITVNYRTRRATRVSYEVHKGPIPEGMCVCHKCDVKSCINPDHLFLGTHQDNMDDMVAKGRSRDRRGERSPLAKMTDEQILLIRADIRSNRAIAAAFGLRKSTISDIKRGRTWRHLLPPAGEQQS